MEVEPTSKYEPARHSTDTIIIVPTAEAEATAWHWQVLGTKRFWTNSSYLDGHIGTVAIWLADGMFQA
jgi:hypothetical protein